MRRLYKEESSVINIVDFNNGLISLYNTSNYKYGMGKIVLNKIYIVLETEYMDIKLLESKRAIIYDDSNNEALVDEFGNFVIPFLKYEKLGRVYKNNIIVFNGSLVGVVDIVDGNEILSPSLNFDNVDLNFDKKNLLFAKNKELNYTFDMDSRKLVLRA